MAGNAGQIEELCSLSARAAAKYATKNYDEAVEFYSRATELQAEIYGEVRPQNAELLFNYGKCLYQIAIKKSDILGMTLTKPQVKSEEHTSPREGPERIGTSSSERAIDSSIKTNSEDPQDQISGLNNEISQARDSLFQFADEAEDTEDECTNGDRTSLVEGDAEPEVENDDEDDNEFAVAFEILDLARILFLRQIQQHNGIPAENIKGDVKSPLETQSAVQVQERLADVLDLQAEISLEGEQFQQAADDFQRALEYKQRCHEPRSSIIAEAHYKLSLALEFLSKTSSDLVKEQEGSDATKAFRDRTRASAVEHMQQAISSCKLRLAYEQANLSEQEASDSSISAAKIREVEEIVVSMEERMQDLLIPPESENIETCKTSDHKSLDETNMQEAQDISAFVRRKVLGSLDGLNNKRKRSIEHETSDPDQAELAKKAKD